MLQGLITRKHNQRQIAKKLVITSANAIVEERFVKVGGIEQWISIRGEDRNNPVLLIVHGGPASTYGIMSHLIRSWEKYFTIVQWDQRGAGRTFRKNGVNGSGKLTFERLVSDGIELTEYLINHLGKEKLILIGSSVGSITGVMMVSKRPELFYAYVGTEQVSPDGGKLSYQLTRDGLRQSGDSKSLHEMERIGPDGSKWSRKDFDRMNKITMNANHQVPNMVTDIILPAMMSTPNFSLFDLMDIAKGMSFSIDQLYDELITFDLYKVGLTFNIPFFIFQGDGDWIAPAAAAQKYLDLISAPHKEMILIKHAGHLAMFANPDQFLKELTSRVGPLAMTYTEA
ncbi:MAG: alpha/beta hydrolase [Chloroflexota bacterium]